MSKRIDINNLNIYYGSFHAVDSVTMTVQPCSVTALIGPSGCGKSTVLRTLNRMHEEIPGARVEGQVLLDGEDIYNPALDRVSVRRTIGMVFQRPNPFPTMSIRDNVVAGLRLQGVRDRKTLDEVAERALRGANLWTEVKDRLGKPGASLSGGQQQRLCIARAIAIQPDVLLMDEPCSALDPISTLAVEDLIGELRQEFTIVIVTHNMQQAARVSDQTAFFNLAGVGTAGAAHRDRYYEDHVFGSQGGGDRGLHLGSLWLICAAVLSQSSGPRRPVAVRATRSGRGSRAMPGEARSDHRRSAPAGEWGDPLTMLLVEPDEELGRRLVEPARQRGLRIVWSRDGGDALVRAGATRPISSSSPPNCRQWTAPRSSGPSSTNGKCASSSVPRRRDEALARAALDAGAHATVARPYNLDALLRIGLGVEPINEAGLDTTGVLSAGPVIVDLGRHEAWLDTREVHTHRARIAATGVPDPPPRPGRRPPRDQSRRLGA